MAALLLAVFLGRSLVPVGFMPGPGGLMLCPAFGAGPAAVGQPMAMDMPGHDMAAMHAAGAAHDGMGHHGMGHHGMGHHGMGHEGSCSYATAASASMLAGAQSPLPVAYVPNAPPEVAAPAERLIPRGTIVPTRLPRGPPTLS